MAPCGDENSLVRHLLPKNDDFYTGILITLQKWIKRKTIFFENRLSVPMALSIKFLIDVHFS